VEVFYENNINRPRPKNGRRHGEGAGFSQIQPKQTDGLNGKKEKERNSRMEISKKIWPTGF